MAQRLRAALEHPPSAGSCWADLGRRFVEFSCADVLAEHVEITPTAQRRFDAAVAGGRGVLVATLHLGNWELMAAALVRSGIDFAAVGAQPKHSPLHRWLATTRSALGITVLSPGGGAHAAKTRLSNGGVLALFVDQATRERCRPIPFFHAQALTPTTYERLLTLSNAQPLLVWMIRDSDGIHRIHAEEIPSKATPTTPKADPIRPLDWVTPRAEALIRAHPTQWVWLHDRWRRHANEVMNKVPPTRTGHETDQERGQAAFDLVE